MLSAPYTLVLLAAAAVSAALAIYVWRRRDARGAGAVMLMMLAVVVWSLGYAFEIGAAGLGTKVFWAKLEYLGIVTVPFAWFVFAVRYTCRDRWITRRNLALLAVVPLATLLLVATNEAHGLVWSRTALDPSGRFLALDYGAWFWVYLAYSYALLALGTFYLISTLVRSPRVYREQGAALLVAVAAPWVGNGMYVTGLSPAPNLDLTPFAFLISGAALSFGLFRLRLLDIVPVARDAVIEGMDDGVIVVDDEGRLVDLNPAAGRILGHPEPVGEELCRLAPGLDARLAGTSGEEVELGEGASRRSYDLSVSPLRDRGGRRTGRLLVLHDITERKRSEEALIRQRTELARSNAELENFAYLIAHDLRAPLRGVDGFSHILLEDHADRLDEEGQDLLRRVREGALRMGQLIDDLLELSRLARAEMNRQRVDLSALARVIVEELERDPSGRAVEFVISESPTADGDARLLEAALRNLLDNARKFTSKEPHPRVEFGATENNGLPVYHVRDNGVGFDPAYSDKLFGVFQRLHAPEEFEGTGMGLATVQRVVERHGGRVWAEGSVGRGATIYFTLSPENRQEG
ncbi:MAG: ATP-binding protein [Actinomycetota bacterium]|nr:ATP-binding protein [Actinomycetota bacterium]MDP9481425.1 ATP-binding protein [Actinomycetota bacterium]MDP9488490.1 ATP-binding protein [Actinomycetota bacterium]